MKKLILAIAIVVCGCSPRLVPPTTIEHSTDSVIRERVIHDTAIFYLPREVEKIVTRDTSSHLENTYAKSDAFVDSLGLHHSLESKPQYIRVPYTTVVHDTTIVTQDAETIIKEVPATLTSWQTFCLVLGKIALALVIIVSLLAIAYVIIKTKLKI